MNEWTIRQLAHRAHEALPEDVVDYLETGAEDELTLRANLAAWDDYRFQPAVLKDVSAIAVETTLLGLSLAHPVMLAPVAQQALFHPAAESESVAGAALAHSIYVQSGNGSLSLAEVASAARQSGAGWMFQLFPQGDRVLDKELVDTAVGLGASAVMVTVDSPMLAIRDRDRRNTVHRPRRVQSAMLSREVIVGGGGEQTISTLYNPVTSPAVTWADIESLRTSTSTPMLIKGVLRPDDALRATSIGIDAVVVSNHGGRNLDGAEPTASVLPRILDAVAGQAPIVVDGGIRRGSQIAKARCLGASAVMIGRPYIYGLAASGSLGVQRAVEILLHELRICMGYLGAATLEDLRPDLLR